MAGAGYQVGKGFSVAPNAPTPTSNGSWTATTGGSLAAATYYGRYTFVTANGETAPSPEISVAVSGSNNAINVSVVTSLWNACPGATACNIYLSTASGQESYQGQITTVGGSLIITSLATNGKPIPQWNTTSFQDINPSAIGLAAGSEFIIHNLYYNNPVAFGMWDGTTLVMFDGDTGNGAREKVAHHCNGSQWLRVFNQASNAYLQVSFDGMQTQ